MTITKLIEHGIAGGWMSEEPNIKLGCYETFIENQPHWKFKRKKDLFLERIYLEKILLDPKFWQAVGKSCGWYEMKHNGTELDNHPARMHEWQDKFLGLPKALLKGQSIKEYIKTL